MASTHSMPTATSTRKETTDYATGDGWILFSGVIIVVIGVLNVIYGIAAIDRSKFFVANSQYIISDLRTWGWVMLILGALQVLAAFSIWNGGAFGRWFGIGVASVNAIAALLSISGYPLWSLAIFGVDVLVIYGLAAHGGSNRSI